MSGKGSGGANEIYGNFNSSKFNNNPSNQRLALIERMHFRSFTELCANRFQWLNLPKTVNVRYMELTIFYRGVSIFYEDEKFGFRALQGAGQNWLNLEQDPVGFNVVGSGGPDFASKQLSAVRDIPGARKAIPIWGNYTRTPELDVVWLYATKLADIDRSIEINAHNARQTKFIMATESQRLSLENINRQIDEGQQFISVHGSWQDTELVKAIDLGIDTKDISELQTIRKGMWNEAMTLLGIENSNQDKKERLVEAEVSGNDSQSDMFRFSNINARRIAIEQINEYYGLDISVEYYTKAEDKEEAEEAAKQGANQAADNAIESENE